MCKHTHVGVGVTGSDDNTVRHTNKLHESRRRAGSRSRGLLTTLTLEDRAKAGGQLSGMSQAPNCARLGHMPAQNSGVPGTIVAHWANTRLTHSPGQTLCPPPMAGCDQGALGLAPVPTVNSGSPRVSHSQ